MCLQETVTLFWVLFGFIWVTFISILRKTIENPNAQFYNLLLYVCRKGGDTPLLTHFCQKWVKDGIISVIMTFLIIKSLILHPKNKNDKKGVLNSCLHF